jgi:DtxR family Mn-dependent transcriptional regulator
VLSVDEVEAEACACRMEHAVPQDVLNRIVEFVGFTQSSPLHAVQWDDEQECFLMASEDADG